MNATTAVANRAAGAVRELATLTRPAVTDLNTGDLYALNGALTELVAALPQVLQQLAGYPAAGDAGACLTQASSIAAHLTAVLDTAHQTLGDTAESIQTDQKGVSFQPT